MKKFVWNDEKALALKNSGFRGRVGVEECVLALENRKMLADIPNPSPKYPHQRMFILEINNYAHVVPYLPDDDEFFLKTVFPSRKYTAIYLKDYANE